MRSYGKVSIISETAQEEGCTDSIDGVTFLRHDLSYSLSVVLGVT
jgi:hypothetical protein